MDEMREYYSSDKNIIGKLDELEKNRERLKDPKTKEPRPIRQKIAVLKNEVRDLQLKFYDKLKKIRVRSAGGSVGGLILEHPFEKHFHLNKDDTVLLPQEQAKDLIEKGIAQEVK